MQWNNRKSNHSNRSVWSSGRRNKETTTCPACHATQYNEKVKKSRDCIKMEKNKKIE